MCSPKTLVVCVPLPSLNFWRHFGREGGTALVLLKKKKKKKKSILLKMTKYPFVLSIT